MARHGYRMYQIELREGHKQAKVNFAKSGDSHYREALTDLVDILKENRWGKPKLRKSEEDEGPSETPGYGDPAFRVTRIGWYGNTLFGELLVGRYGEFPLALGSSRSDDADISGQAPARTFRFVLTLPDDGEAGILGVELVGQKCPVAELTSWLSLASKEASEEYGAANPDKGDLPWWYLKAYQLTDLDHLKTVIRQGQTTHIELEKYSVLADRTKRVTEFRITVPTLTGNQITQVAELMTKWWERNKSDEASASTRVSDQEGAADLSVLVGGEVATHNFDDGWVVVDDGTGRTKKISPDRMSELFSYTINWEISPSDRTFYNAIRRKAQELGPPKGVYLTWPAPEDYPRPT